MNAFPNFENDVFISYAHIDNEALTKGQEGWIDQFHYALERRLNQLMGAESKVWRDKKLRGNDYFDDLISKQFPRTALLVSVLSPRYVRSDWCLKELREFCRASEETGGVRIEDKARVFKVVKTHVPREDHPPELQELLGCDFYRMDSAGRPREFLIDPRHESYAEFQLKLDDLAYEIQETLFFMRPELTKTKARQEPSARGTIYLAETTFDLQQERDEIRREFKPRGTTILPNRSLPLEAGAFKNLVQDAIQQSNVCVHLIGRHYGVIPEGESRSIVCLQNEIAGETSQHRALSRIIWLPSLLEAPEERQKQFIDYLENEIAGQPHVELLKGKVQDLKTVIHDKLGQNGSQSTDSERQSGPSRIYLICDQRDREAVQRLDDYLYEQGYEVILPLREGEDTQVLEDHKNNLRRADAALIFYGTANEFWLRRKLEELEKDYGYGRKKWQAKAVYIGGPTSSEKERYRTHEAIVMRQPNDFDAAALAPFLAKLKKPT